MLGLSGAVRPALAADGPAGIITGDREYFWAGDARNVVTGFKG
jgi:hypothetical protein